MTNSYLFKSYYAIIPLLIVGISLGYTTFALALLALIPLLFMTNRHVVGIFLLMFGGPLAGAIRAVYPFMPIYGVMFDFLGVVFLWDIMIDLFRNQTKSVLALLITFAFFCFFYLLGPQTVFAKEKFLTMCTHGSYMLLGYYAIERSTKIDAESLARILLVASICLSAYVIKTCSMHPGDFFDYDWFRSQSMFFFRMNEGMREGVVDYQHIGMLVLFSAAIFIAQTKLRVTQTFFYMICASQLVLVSGCRQAMLGVALVIALRFVVFQTTNIKRKNYLGYILWILLGSFVAYYILLAFFQNLQSEVVSQTLESGDEGRMMHYLSSISIFNDSPLLGSGIGGYNARTGEPWPHNFILELLCETGVIGLVVALFLLIIPLVKKKQGILHVTTSNQFFFLILTAIIVRVMVSGDFRISIEIFSAIFAIKAVGPLYVLRKNEMNITNHNRFKIS